MKGLAPRLAAGCLKMAFSCERRAKRHSIGVSKETLRKWMIAGGLWENKTGKVMVDQPKNGGWNVLKWLIVTGASGYAESSCHPMGELRGS